MPQTSAPIDAKRARGLWRNEEGNPGKFEVRRTDGTDAPGGKHHGCRYFVLDLDHDQHGRVAALAYAASARRDGFGKLAEELEHLVSSCQVDAYDQSRATTATTIDPDGGRP